MNSVSKRQKNKNRTQGSSLSPQQGNGAFPLRIPTGSVQSKLLTNAGISQNSSNGDLLAFAESAYHAGNLDIAESGYLSFLKKAPKNPRALTLYAILLQDRERYEKSLQILRKSISIDPDQPATLNALGSAYRVLGQFEEAIVAFEKAVALEPKSAEILNNMGVTYREAGYFDEAVDCYERALELNPSLSEAWNGLVRTQKFTKVPERLPHLKQAVMASSMSKQSRRHAFYAIAKIYDDLGDYDEAFKFYKQANEQRLAPADADSACVLMTKICEYFSSDYLSRAPYAKSKPGDPKPVFILGMPRSGTTLVEQVLSMHPKVEWGGELNFFKEEANKLRSEGIFGRKTFPASISDLTAAGMARIRADFLKRFSGRRDSKRDRSLVVTDKTPFNFLYMGLIALALPDAVILHCRRSAMDTCLSVYFTDFAKNQPFSTDLKTIGKYFNCYKGLMAHWQEISALPVLDVDYEALVNHQERESRKIVEFCGLEWDERCLSFHENRRLVSTPSDWQVRQPIYDASIGRWQNYEEYLEPLRKQLADQT